MPIHNLLARSFGAAVLLAAAVPAVAADKSPGGVKSVELTVEPAEAKPGQTVTVKITVVLEAGYHTYPLVQTDKAAANMVNAVTWPEASAAGLIFVGAEGESGEEKTKAEPALGITAMTVYHGTVVYERRAIVSPKASAGELKVTIPKFSLSVCDKDNCFPPKTLKPEAALKVAGAAVEVDKKYADEVAKALAGK